MLRTPSRLIASLAIGLIGGAVLLADGAQTGTLVGVVKDDKGMPLAGAAIRIMGTTLMGERILTTSQAGIFRAPSLPPGSAYEVTVVAEGYQTSKVAARIGVNQVYQMTVQLQPIASSVVEVVAMGTSIDTTTVASPTNMDRFMIDNLPMPGGREYQGIMALTPGIVGSGNPSALGGNDSENLYLLDGVDTTDATSGTFSMNLNMEAIEEVQVLTTGLSAEYGRFGGAIANVVTKSGGNTFEGGLRFDFFNLAWDSKGKWPNPAQSNLSYTPSLSLGGPLVKDKLWFFVTAQSTKLEELKSLDNQTTYSRIFKSDPAAYSAKLTWQINPNHSLSLQMTGDPTYIDNENPSESNKAGTLSALPNQSQEVKFASLTYRAVPYQDITFDMKLARHDHRINQISKVGSAISKLDIKNKWFVDNIPTEGGTKRNRTQFNAAMTWYPQHHQVKTGIDYQATKSSIHTWFPGGLSLDIDGYKDGKPVPLALLVQKNEIQNKSNQDYVALYVNDSWRIGQHLVANLGVRLEKTAGKNTEGLKLWDFVGTSPRIGLTYDWKGNGYQSLGLNYARYMIMPKQAILDDFTGSIHHYDIYGNYAPGANSENDIYNPTNYEFLESFYTPSFTFDDNVKAGYVDEFVVSSKFQLAEAWTLNMQAVSRDFRNPMFLYKYYDGPSINELKLYSELRNASDAKREYRALINSLDYQGSKWMMRLSYVYSSLRGNYEDSNHLSAYGNFFEGKYIPKYNDARAWGRLSSDQPHTFRLMANYRFDLGNWNISQGVFASYSSGNAWTLNADWTDELSDTPPIVMDNRDNKHNVTENGTRGDHRFPSRFRLHYTLLANYSLTKNARLFFGLDIYNILNNLRTEYYITGENKAYVDNGNLSIEKHERFGESTPEHYTPGRQIRFTTGLRF